jgi:hypothetical protein
LFIVIRHAGLADFSPKKKNRKQTEDCFVRTMCVLSDYSHILKDPILVLRELISFQKESKGTF